jgi:hypothetical protein
MANLSLNPRRENVSPAPPIDPELAEVVNSAPQAGAFSKRRPTPRALPRHAPAVSGAPTPGMNEPPAPGRPQPVRSHEILLTVHARLIPLAEKPDEAPNSRTTTDDFFYESGLGPPGAPENLLYSILAVSAAVDRDQLKLWAWDVIMELSEQGGDISGFQMPEMWVRKGRTGIPAIYEPLLDATVKMCMAGFVRKDHGKD